MRVEEDNFCVMKWTAMKVYYFMNLVSYTHASCLMPHASLPHVTNSTNDEWGLRLWGPIITLEPAPSLLRAGYTKSCDFVSVARFLLLVFLSPVFSWASILRLRHSFEIIQNRVTCSDLKYDFFLMHTKVLFSSIPLLLIVTECSGKWKCSEYLFEPLFALLNV